MNDLEAQLRIVLTRRASAVAVEAPDAAEVISAARRRRRRNRSIGAALVAAGVVLICGVGFAIVTTSRDPNPVQVTSGGAGRADVELVTREGVVQVGSGGTTVDPALELTDAPSGTQEFVRTRDGLVGVVGSGPGARLIRIDGSTVATLVDAPVAGAAVSHDRSSVAWASPHFDPAGYITATTFVAARLPDMAELTRTEFVGNARITGLAGALALLSIGDGASGHAGTWDPSTGAVVEFAQSAGLLVDGAADGTVLIIGAEQGCGTGQLSRDTAQALSALTPVDCGGLGALSPDGSILAATRTTNGSGELVLSDTRHGTRSSALRIEGQGPVVALSWIDEHRIAVITGGTAGYDVTVCSDDDCTLLAALSPLAGPGPLPAALVIE